MVDKFDLNGVVASLLDTLRMRMNPMFSQKLLERWTGLLIRAAAVARDLDWWAEIADQDERYAPTAALLEAGTRTLAAAKPKENALNAALDMVERGIIALEALYTAD